MNNRQKRPVTPIPRIAWPSQITGTPERFEIRQTPTAVAVSDAAKGKAAAPPLMYPAIITVAPAHNIDRLKANEIETPGERCNNQDRRSHKPANRPLDMAIAVPDCHKVHSLPPPPR